MNDMLVKLYSLPDAKPFIFKLNSNGIEVRQSDPSEKSILFDWIKRNFKNLGPQDVIWLSNESL